MKNFQSRHSKICEKKIQIKCVETEMKISKQCRKEQWIDYCTKKTTLVCGYWPNRGCNIYKQKYTELVTGLWFL